MSFSMICGEENVQVELNINAQRQIQIKICKNGTCHQLISHPEKIEKRAENPLKIILF